MQDCNVVGSLVVTPHLLESVQDCVCVPLVQVLNPVQDQFGVQVVGGVNGGVGVGGRSVEHPYNKFNSFLVAERT